MIYKTIPITNSILKASGRVFYNDRRHRLDIKKPIRDLFEGSPDVWYIMEVCLNETKFAERVKELKEKKITPVLMYFVTKGDVDEE